MAKKKTKRKATSKIKGMKRCPACKGTGTCRECDGHGEVRIVKGRSKGNKFENQTAKQITEWTGVEFKRTPMSGGWAKTGDITPKNPKAMIDFPFTIECKNNESFNAGGLIQSAKEGTLPKNVKSWWKQCTDDSKKSKKIPLLVMTKAREPVYVMMFRTTFNGLDLMKNCSAVIRFAGLRVMLWEEFLAKPYEEIVEVLGDKCK